MIRADKVQPWVAVKFLTVSFPSPMPALPHCYVTVVTALLMAQVPEGATPRTLSVHLMGEVTRSIKPGDDVTITGIFLPEQYTGFRAMRCVWRIVSVHGSFSGTQQDNAVNWTCQKTHTVASCFLSISCHSLSV